MLDLLTYVTRVYIEEKHYIVASQKVDVRNVRLAWFPTLLYAL